MSITREMEHLSNEESLRQLVFSSLERIMFPGYLALLGRPTRKMADSFYKHM